MAKIENHSYTIEEAFREWFYIVPDYQREYVWTEKEVQQLIDDINEQIDGDVIQKLLFKAQVDVNEVTGENDPVVQLIDFVHPERNVFQAINQFRIDTPGCVKSFIIPDIVLFVNGIPLVVIEAKIGDANTANPLHAAFEQLLRYRNGEGHSVGGPARRRGEIISHQFITHSHLW